ncbi:fumarylacetoacetate hydrolase family protein [Gordonia hankookensis]|uniref:Fumarylacetoacetate hydrolase family protein n=1 Tax=Gordonia hankookensis TaxID=589403 RepID=A0ABR7WC71_9ACTN|nr:fumarylacetoacetate hydrolase family protein [Gordonia hankookensis]MBD1320146.1 fumarylacetoacetate hydrolase family protein [Gordonia hankookensis]
MRFATVTVDGDTSAAVVTDDAVYLLGRGRQMIDVIGQGLDGALAEGARAIARGRHIDHSDVAFEAPVQPPSIRDFVAFAEHVEGVRASMQGAGGVPEAWCDAPHFYFTNPYAVVGPDAVVRAPGGSGQLDFELEVAAVVGTAGSDVAVGAAAELIFGYTILNDWSARDLQRREMEIGLGPAKGKDFANSLGPVIVTADEFTDRVDGDGFLELACTVCVNGEEIGSDVTTNMGWSFAAMVAFASRDSAVRPGDVLGSGTIGNGGCLAELWGRRGTLDPSPLQRGDVVELTVEGIGTLRNTIGSPRPAGVPLPAPRTTDQQRRRSEHARR